MNKPILLVDVVRAGMGMNEYYRVEFYRIEYLREHWTREPCLAISIAIVHEVKQWEQNTFGLDKEEEEEENSVI